MSASILDDATLAHWRAEAEAEAGPFVDPALIREAEQVWPTVVDQAWLDRVVGRSVLHWRALTNAELSLTVRAIKADQAFLEGIATARRAEWERRSAEAAKAAAQVGWDAWQTLRDRLPVPVLVQHNWTARHLDGYEQGADHIVVTEDLHVGRLRRAASHPLCWTASRAHQLRHVSGNLVGQPYFVIWGVAGMT